MTIDNALDRQEGGNHYKQFKIQPAEFCEKNQLSFCEGNVIKYTCRHRFKNGLQDLLKAKHYLDILIEIHYSGGTNQDISESLISLNEMNSQDD